MCTGEELSGYSLLVIRSSSVYRSAAVGYVRSHVSNITLYVSVCDYIKYIIPLTMMAQGFILICLVTILYVNPLRAA